MKLVLENNRNFRCSTTACPFRHECANHDTAGDFRSEDGFSPQVAKIGENWFCDTCDAEIDSTIRYQTLPKNYNSLGRGFVFLDEDGKLTTYSMFEKFTDF